MGLGAFEAQFMPMPIFPEHLKRVSVRRLEIRQPPPRLGAYLVELFTCLSDLGFRAPIDLQAIADALSMLHNI